MAAAPALPPEPHAPVGWMLETDPEGIIATEPAPALVRGLQGGS